jgi:hypothetical protein
MMDIHTYNEYVAPEVRCVEVITEEGFAISGIIINERYQQNGEYIEKHIVDDVETW